ncbi:LysR family transcriptional regulator [Paraburkholderia sp. D15]|uniref:LysR family transcriptional regulator n=1 Tax=Paraburkholderia sp. D15 TaxID=2880218 RepID=UPI00247A1661|nr:LysR family transcriptional regulator [Paraburkholderia sp. D15]WGS48326.1 LysR family transcriptional regulator [Paraburkholderia sp. D15]WKF56200.1 HTH-type transcriptional regulator GltC [Paraburkholderia busanensis]
MTLSLHGIALRYFVEVARTGSISDASARLHVAVSAISRQIARLESELGVALFERRPRGMALSEAGERLLAYAQRSLLEAAHVMKEIGGLESLHGSMIKLASSEGFAADFLPTAMASFRDQYPGIDFTLSVMSPGAATRCVRDGDADLALTFSLAPEKGVKVEHTERAPVYALLRAGHPLATRARVSLADLRAYPLVLPAPGTTIRQLIDITCALEGILLDPDLTCNNSGAMYRYAQKSGAVMFTGLLSVRDRYAGDGFVMMPLTHPQMRQRSIQVQTMAGRELPSAVRAFRDHLIAEIARPKPGGDGAPKAAGHRRRRPAA